MLPFVGAADSRPSGAYYAPLRTSAPFLRRVYRVHPQTKSSGPPLQSGYSLKKRSGTKNITLRRGGYQPPAGRMVCAPTDIGFHFLGLCTVRTRRRNPSARRYEAAPNRSLAERVQFEK